MLKPSNNRSWVNDNDRLTNAEFDGDYVIIKNIRDFNWKSTRDYDERWIEKKFNLVTEQFRNIKVSTDKIQSRAEKIQDLEGIKTEEIKK